MTSGIYCFKHISKPYIYIGSSVNIETRYKQHLLSFERKTHPNPTLQKDFLQNNLEFEILSKNITQRNLLKMEEQFCENYLQLGYLLYNRSLPRPQDYDNVMMCARNTLNKLEDYDDLQDVLKYQESSLKECYHTIYKLNQEVRRLKQELGHNLGRENIFAQIELYGEIKDW